jgi:polyhydroxybutyrate depolymerase
METVDAGRGAVTVEVSANYNPNNPAPLLILLHGRAWSGQSMENYFDFSAEANQRGYIYCYPNGMASFTGIRYWNATDACCCQGFPFTTCSDDVGYLTQLIAVLQDTYNIQPDSVHLVGHSNGAFMAHRMACEKSELLASIVTVSGMNWSDPALCNPTEPMPVLQVHGEADLIILYNGGVLGVGVYPSAQETCQQWASLNGCDPIGQILAPLDLNSSASGAETEVLRWASGCSPNSPVELWSMGQSGHLPNFNDLFRTMVFDFMASHAGPPTSFIRGDTNGDAALDLADVIQVLQFLFNGGPIDCIETGNSNSDGSLDLSDAIFMLLHLFSSGIPPGDPHPLCGNGPVLIECATGSCP